MARNTAEGDLPAVWRPGREEAACPRLNLPFSPSFGIDYEDAFEPDPVRVGCVATARGAEDYVSSVGREIGVEVVARSGVGEPPASAPVRVYDPDVTAKRAERDRSMKRRGRYDGNWGRALSLG